MSSPKFKLDTNAPTVSWADPKNTESSAASQVSYYLCFLLHSDKLFYSSALALFSVSIVHFLFFTEGWGIAMDFAYRILSLFRIIFPICWQYS